MAGKPLALVVLLAVLAGLVWHKVQNAERVLSRVEELPNPPGGPGRTGSAPPRSGGEPRSRPRGAVAGAVAGSGQRSAPPTLEALLRSHVARAVPYRPATRDIFSYVLPRTRPKPRGEVRKPPPSPPPPPPPPPPRRLKPEDIDVHGFHEDRPAGRVTVFLTYKDELFIARAGTVLPGGVKVVEISRGRLVLETADGLEREEFELP